MSGSALNVLIVTKRRRIHSDMSSPNMCPVSTFAPCVVKVIPVEIV